MKKLWKKIKAVKLSTWLWVSLIVVLFVSAIVALTIFLYSNGWTWMVVFGNKWFIFFSIAAVLLAGTLGFWAYRSKLTKIK